MLGFRLRCKLAIKGLELILVVEHYRMWIFRCRDKNLHKKSVAEDICVASECGDCLLVKWTETFS